MDQVKRCEYFLCKAVIPVNTECNTVVKTCTESKYKSCVAVHKCVPVYSGETLKMSAADMCAYLIYIVFD